MANYPDVKDFLVRHILEEVNPLRKEEHYMIAGPFGLTGWTHIESGYYTPIKHLVFRGD